MKSILTFLFLIVAIFGLTTMAAYSIQNNGLPDLLGQWLPGIVKEAQDGPRPEDTLIAPFADLNHDGRGPADNELAIPHTPESGINVEADLTLPHRSDDELKKWLVDSISSVLTIDSRVYQSHLTKVRERLDEYGMEDFEAFISSSNVLAILQSRNLLLRPYVEEPPLMLDSGVAQDAYRWLYDIPVTMSFLPEEVGSYSDVEEGDVMSESIMIKVQVGRNSAAIHDGMMIESWEVRRNRR